MHLYGSTGGQRVLVLLDDARRIVKVRRIDAETDLVTTGYGSGVQPTERPGVVVVDSIEVVLDPGQDPAVSALLRALTGEPDDQSQTDVSEPLAVQPQPGPSPPPIVTLAPPADGSSPRPAAGVGPTAPAGVDTPMKVAAGGFGIAALIGLLAPAFSYLDDPFRLSDDGSDVAFFVLLAIALCAYAMFVLRPAHVAAGVIGGAAATVGGYFAYFASVTHAVFGGEDIDYGAGHYFSILAAIAGVIALVMAVQRRTPPALSETTLDGAFAPLGVCSALGVTLGMMLPPNDSGVSFSDRNFELPDGWFQFGWLVFLASLCVPPLIGFASRSRWGLAMAAASWLLTAWLTLFSIIKDPGEEGLIGNNVHPVLPIAVIVSAVALVLGYQAALSARAAAAAPASPVPPPPPPASPIEGTAPKVAPAPLAAATPAGRWAPDPYGRHQSRYFDGSGWTDTVADDGATTSDTAAHPTPDGAAGGTWAPDPFGRHRQRYCDGSRWTRHVADGAGVAAVDEPTYPPPP